MKSVKIILSLILLIPTFAFSMDFYWEGNYSVEGNYFSGVDLGNSDDGDKMYLNHHLFLRPEIILYEGLSFHGGLDVLNGDANLPPSSRVGQILGGDLTSNASSYSPDMPAAFLQRQLQKSRAVNISEAYLKYSHTNGELRIGRLPIEFGYGAFYNSGHDVFDHWYTNRDGISYEFTMGSLKFTPMINFLSDALESDGQTTEFGLKFNFNVEDTGLDLGFMVLQRHIPTSQNKLNAVPGGEFGSAKPITYGIFYNRKNKKTRYGFEALIQDGSAGVDASGSKISHKGIGIAGEFDWNRKSWDFSAKAGYATGNDPNDAGAISSVSMHRNYNLGMILFNHPVGDASYDPLGTSLKGRNGSQGTNFRANESVDTDSISNAMYLAPSATYRFSDKWKLETTLVFAWLEETKVLAGAGEVSSYLGSEVDLTLTYKPTENIVHATTLGFFMPGSAFETGGLEADTAFGVTTSLGITF